MLHFEGYGNFADYFGLHWRYHHWGYYRVYPGAFKIGIFSPLLYQLIHPA
jgi:hypothetical protein